MKWMTWAVSGGLAERGRRMLSLRFDQAEMFAHGITQALRLVAPADHDLANGLDGGRIRGIEEKHRGKGAGIEFLLVLQAQEVAHGDGDIAEVDVHRAGVEALVAYRAVVGDIVEFVEMLQ